MGPAVMESVKISCEPCNEERGATGFEKFTGDLPPEDWTV
jgi:hypothetical protein